MEHLCTLGCELSGVKLTRTVLKSLANGYNKRVFVQLDEMSIWIAYEEIPNDERQLF